MSGRRGTSLSPPEAYLLNQWARTLAESFAEPDGCWNYPYLVGSVARAEPWRDVDVRLMLTSAEYDRLTYCGQRLQALNVAFSLWGQRATGLPIDFQFQDENRANAEFNGVRIALGLVTP